MPFEVVDPVEGPTEPKGHGPTEGEPHQQTAHQPGATGGGDGVELAERHTRRFEGLSADGRPIGQVLARGDFGDHATIGLVGGELARDHRSQHAPPAIDHGAGGIVAGGLDSENQGAFEVHGPMLI